MTELDAAVKDMAMLRVEIERLEKEISINRAILAGLMQPYHR